MKRAFLVALTFGLYMSAYAHDAQVEITVGRRSLESQPAVSRLLLSRKANELRCRGASVPEHAILVPELKGLDAPFHNESITSSCSMIITWGKTQACYQRHRFPVVDDVLSWCLNI